MPYRCPDKPLPGLDSKTEWRVRCSMLGLGWLLTMVLLWAGCERREITRPTPQMHVASQFWVRVLLISEETECTIDAPSSIDAGRCPQDGVTSEAATPIGSFGGPLRVSASGGQLMLGTTPAQDNQVLLSTDEPHVLTLNERRYRGKLKISINEDGQTLRVINLVPLEPYLAGVVGAEMPSYWEPEALKAQAIAARTYCLYTKNRFGRRRQWDVRSSEASQVYRGTEAESAQIWNAVTGTYGQVLATGESTSADPELFPTYYSAVCGGYTADCKSVFGENFGPLQSVECPYCKNVAKLGLFFWPMAQFDAATITDQVATRYPAFVPLGQIRQVDVVERSDRGPLSRLASIRLTGATGKSRSIRAENFRLSLDPTGRKIQSTMCDLVPWGNGWAFTAGRGWGHGVGMCQCGAEGMARQGKAAEQILQHYYPGAQIVSIY